MSDEENKIEQSVEENKDDNKVTLSKEEYAEMVSKINTMTGAIEDLLSKETEKEQRTEAEKRAIQARREQENRAPAKDLDLMSNKELASVILSEVESKLGRPLLQMISTLAVKDEKRDLATYIKKQNETDEDGKPITIEYYEDEIFKIATEKPTLSLMEAYEIAKSRTKPKAKEKEKKPESGPQFGGEKPSGGKFAVGGKLTLEQASKKAMDELKGRFPE